MIITFQALHVAAATIAVLLTACSTALWKKYPLSTLPDFACSTEGEAGYDVYVWECVNQKRIVISRFCAGLYPCSSEKREEVPCGTKSQLEDQLTQRGIEYPQCQKSPKPWQIDTTKSPGASGP